MSKILIEIPDWQYNSIKDNQRDIGVMTNIICSVIHGTVLPEDCEILTKDAYADLCARASNYNLDNMKEEIADTLNFWEYEPNSKNPTVKDMLECINEHCGTIEYKDGGWEVRYEENN